MELLAKTPNIDFLGRGKWLLLLSAACIAGTIYLWISLGDKKYGTDYTGGHEYVVRFNQGVKVDSNRLRSLLEEAGFSEAVVQSFESANNDYALRLPAEGGDAKATDAKVKQALDKAYPAQYTEQSSSFIGPTIGKEMQRKALIATILSLLGILAYITYRFEFAFALGAVLAVFHDVVISLGFYLLMGHTLNMLSLAALLTIIGYSVNDTIVVFDRMREEIFKSKEYELVPLMNRCINATLSRTIITSLLTLFAALALLMFGGGAIQDLSLFMCIGIVAGTYSTIFVASPITLGWETLMHPPAKTAAAKAAK